MVTWTMNDNEKLDDILRKDLDVRASAGTYTHMRNTVLEAHETINKTNSAATPTIAGRFTMRRPMIRFALAAAIIAAVVLGLFEFIDTGSTTGVVWAEVAQKVEASPGVIWRIRGTGSRDPNDDWPDAYKITWRSAAVTRTDRYRDGQLYRTIYYSLDAKTMIGVLHDAQKYSKEAMSDERVQRAQADKERWSTPQGLVNLCLTLEHHELGQQTIDGVLCEGIEATIPNGPSGRLWVSVETGYPVLVEVEMIGGDDGSIQQTSTLDQFQWNVDLSAGNAEPEIPADYEPL
jgi:hypothetical protein